LTNLKTKQTGFSLLEVLVAFVVLALVLGVLMQIFSGGIRNTNRATHHQEAILLAKSKLASVGIEIPLQLGEITGSFGKRYHWKLNISHHQDDGIQSYDQNAATALIVPVILLNTTIEVFWNEPDASGSVKLQTLKMARVR
jgi:general secretion pathway protein I